MGKPYDILIIDDEEVVVNATIKIMSLEGFTVDSALDAKTGLEKLATQQYRLLLTDLMLPDMSGYEVITYMKAKGIQIPIILITGYATLDNAVKAMKMGIFDFIPKPFEIEELLGVTLRAWRVQADDIPADPPCPSRRYLGKHAWVDIDSDGRAHIGAAALFRKTVGTINHIHFPARGQEVKQGGQCLKFQTDDTYQHTLWSPLSGIVIETNHTIQQHPTRLKDENPWLVQLLPSNMDAEIKHLTL
ncbi:MAG: response regulator [Gemmatimonadetes bacterium]|nr:MAG: response regulator [Gemmatimonadota bacterium]